MNMTLEAARQTMGKFGFAATRTAAGRVVTQFGDHEDEPHKQLLRAASVVIYHGDKTKVVRKEIRYA